MGSPFEKQQAADFSGITSEVTHRLNEYSRRMKTIEQRLDHVEQQMQSIEETALTQMDDIRVNLERIVAKITGIAERLSGIENELLRINKELGKTATKSEVKQFETYIDVMNPIKSKFVTKDELERTLDERIKKHA
jgi:chromosome segregation ATPase